MWKSTVLWEPFSSKVVLISYLLKGWGKEYQPEAGTGWELGVIYLKVHFFFRRESSLFCIEWWGGPGGEF